MRDELDPKRRFSDRAADYAKFRPTYPKEAIDAVLEGLGDLAALRAADVGAGTGISSRLLGDRGVSVAAVEPNAAMREAAAPHARVRWVQGSGEQTGLEAGSVGLVLCAQSFHWFDATAALAEFRRILCPGGRLALVWNDRDISHPMSDAYYRIVLSTPIGAGVAQTWAGENPLVGVAGFRSSRERFFTLEQWLDAPSLLGRAMSASYMPRSGAEHDRIVRELTALHERMADERGLAMMRYRTKVFLAEAE